MKNTFNLLFISTLLSTSIAYSATYSKGGYNAKLIDEVTEQGGFNDKNGENYQTGGFNDKNPEKEVNPGWKKY